MVTATYQARIDGKDTSFRFSGLKSDEKPVGAFRGEAIANGSLFVEMETGITYDYDATAKSWVKRSGSGGGGGDIDGDGEPDTIATDGEIDDLIDNIFH